MKRSKRLTFRPLKRLEAIYRGVYADGFVVEQYDFQASVRRDPPDPDADPITVTFPPEKIKRSPSEIEYQDWQYSPL